MHTHTQQHCEPWTLGRSQVGAATLQLTFCGRSFKSERTLFFSPHSHQWRDLGVSPKKGSTASWFMLRWERLAQEQWHFCKTPLCSGETRRGFPSGPSLVPLPLTCQLQQPHGVLSLTNLSSETLAHAQPGWLNPLSAALPEQQHDMLTKVSSWSSQKEHADGESSLM